MAYIQKRVHLSGKVTYRARIRMRGAPEISKSFPSAKKAKKWALRMESEIQDGRYFQRAEHKKRTFGEFIDRYIAKELPKNPKALPKLRIQLNWWKSRLAGYFLCHITPSMIAELKEELLNEMTYRGNFRSTSTANRYLAALSRAFTIGVREWGWLEENPLSKVTRLKEGRARDRFLSKEEISKLLAVREESQSSYLYLIVLFGLGTGARKSEITGLQWKDVHLERGTVTFKNTKNGEDRTLPLTPQLLECLLKLRKHRIVFSEFVFPSIDGTKPADVRTAWDNAVKEAGFKDICFHTLRHTCASYLAMSGSSALEIAAVLGHKTLAMVKRYSHLSVTATEKALNRMHMEVLDRTTA